MGFNNDESMQTETGDGWGEVWKRTVSSTCPRVGMSSQVYHLKDRIQAWCGGTCL